MKYGIKLTFTLLFFFVSTSTFAAMYKSVDEQGNVTYSQSPPKTGDYKTIKAKKYKPASAAETSRISSDAKKTFEQGAKNREENDLVKSELNKNKKLRDKNCNIAKDNLRLFTVYKRLKNDKGEYYRVDDKERAERLKTAGRNIKEFCN